MTLSSKSALSPFGAARSLVSSRLLSSLSRVTTSGTFIPEIDGLRVIAIGTVILFHLAINLSIKAPTTYAIPSEGSWLAAVARQGFHGVELFFIISGFILALPFASHQLKRRPRVDLRQYFLRRLTRLEPPYILCMVLIAVLLILFKGRRPGEIGPHLVASVTYSHNLVYAAESLVNNVAWSLEIEIQFYLLVPLLATIFAIRDTWRRRAVLLTLAALSATGHVLLFELNRRSALTILNYLHFFLLGFLLADVFLVDWDERPRRRWRWDLVSLVGWPALFVVWNWADGATPGAPRQILAGLFFPVSVFALYVAVFRGVLTNRIITNPWITTIGGMCYTIYLLHNYLLGVLIGVTKGAAPTGSYTLNFLVQGLLVVPAVLVACVAYFALVERPCMAKDWPIRARERLRLAWRTRRWLRAAASQPGPAE